MISYISLHLYPSLFQKDGRERLEDQFDLNPLSRNDFNNRSIKLIMIHNFLTKYQSVLNVENVFESILTRYSSILSQLISHTFSEEDVGCFIERSCWRLEVTYQQFHRLFRWSNQVYRLHCLQWLSFLVNVFNNCN